MFGRVCWGVTDPNLSRARQGNFASVMPVLDMVWQGALQTRPGPAPPRCELPGTDRACFTQFCRFSGFTPRSRAPRAMPFPVVRTNATASARNSSP